MNSEVYFGIWTLIPPIVIIAVSVMTRKSFVGLFFGALTGFIMSAGFGSIEKIMGAAIRAAENNASMYLTLGLFGSFIMLITDSKGTGGFSSIVLKYSKSRKKSYILSWILGMIVFMDDYLNILTVSACFKDVLDRQKSPREMLAYIIDSTGAPICVIIPLSTWAIYYGGVFASQPELEYLGSGPTIYMGLLPFIFYGFTAVIVVPLVCLGVIPRLWGMKKAFQRVESGGKVYSEISAPLNESDENAGIDETLQKGKVIDFLLPIVALAVVALYTKDMLLGLIWSIVLCAFLYIPRKLMGFIPYFDKVISGFAYMIPMIAICLASQMVRYSMDSIGLPNYVINATLPYVQAATFPAITFIIIAGLTFVCSSTWGIPAVATPIIVPLAVLSGSHMLMTLGAIVSGAAFGSHACFYSDATVLSAQACKIDSLDHAYTQLPYVLISAALAIALYLAFGLALT